MAKQGSEAVVLVYIDDAIHMVFKEHYLPMLFCSALPAAAGLP